MMTKKNTEQTVSFSASKSMVAFVNNLGKLSIVAVIFVALLFAVAGRIDRLGPIVVVCSIVGICPLLLAFKYRKYIHKIVIDFGNRVLRLHLYRSGGVVEVSFDEILDIRIGTNISFRVKNRRLYCYNPGDQDLIDSLNKIKPKS